MLLGALCSCQLPAPSHALVVRDLAGKCALIQFSGCAAFQQPPREHEPSADQADAN